MEYRPLGRSGLHVSEICLGAMMFGAWGNPDAEECARIIHAALDAGINCIDTAGGYSGGESEEFLGRALRGGRRDGVVLAVKFGPSSDPDPNRRGASRHWAVTGLEESLRRLGTDYIDLYQVGVPDRVTDIEETLSALTDLRAAGKIRAFGHSKFPPSAIVEARWAAERIGSGRFRSEQAPYSMINRAAEYDLLPTCQRHGLGVLAFGALSSGWLSGRYRVGVEDTGPGSPMRRAQTGARGRRFAADAPANVAKLAAVESLAQLAEEIGLSLIQLAVAFSLTHPAVSTTIIGPRTPEHLSAYLAASGVALSDEVLDRIDAIVAPGVSVNVEDTMWEVGSDALSPAARRPTGVPRTPPAG